MIIFDVRSSSLQKRRLFSREHARVFTLIAKMEQLRNSPLPEAVHVALREFYESVKTLQKCRDSERQAILQHLATGIIPELGMLNNLRSFLAVWKTFLKNYEIEFLLFTAILKKCIKIILKISLLHLNNNVAIYNNNNNKSEVIYIKRQQYFIRYIYLIQNII